MLNVAWAEFSNAPPFLRQGKVRGRRRQGILYEAAVHEYLSREMGDGYIQSPWLRFREATDTKDKWCQPDAILLDVASGKLTIIEVKYQHTSQAWGQLKLKYGPVLGHLFPAHLWKIAYVEVVKWYDPAVNFPEHVHLIRDIKQASPGAISVHIYKP